MDCRILRRRTFCPNSHALSCPFFFSPCAIYKTPDDALKSTRVATKKGHHTLLRADAPQEYNLSPREEESYRSVIESTQEELLNWTQGCIAACTSFEQLRQAYKAGQFVLAYFGDTRKVDVLTYTYIEKIDLQADYTFKVNPARDLAKYRKHKTPRLERTLRAMLDRKYKFAGFTRTYVRRHLDCYPELKQYVI